MSFLNNSDYYSPKGEKQSFKTVGLNPTLSLKDLCTSVQSLHAQVKSFREGMIKLAKAEILPLLKIQNNLNYLCEGLQHWRPPKGGRRCDYNRRRRRINSTLKHQSTGVKTLNGKNHIFQESSTGTIHYNLSNNLHNCNQKVRTNESEIKSLNYDSSILNSQYRKVQLEIVELHNFSIINNNNNYSLENELFHSPKNNSNSSELIQIELGPSEGAPITINRNPYEDIKNEPSSEVKTGIAAQPDQLTSKKVHPKSLKGVFNNNAELFTNNNSPTVIHLNESQSFNVKGLYKLSDPRPKVRILSKSDIKVYNGFRNLIKRYQSDKSLGIAKIRGSYQLKNFDISLKKFNITFKLFKDFMLQNMTNGLFWSDITGKGVLNKDNRFASVIYSLDFCIEISEQHLLQGTVLLPQPYTPSVEYVIIHELR